MKMKKCNLKKVRLLSILLVSIVAFLFSAVNVYAEKATITFDSNGGKKVDSIEYTCGEPLGDLPTPTKKDHKFMYWKNDSGTKVKKGDKLSECGPTKLTAVWEENCDEACKRCHDWVSQQSWDALYKVKIVAPEDKTDRIKISMSETNRTSGVANFKVSKVEFIDLDENFHNKSVRIAFTTPESIESNLGIKKDARLTPSKSITLIHNQTTLTRIRVYLVPVDKWYDKELVGYCGDDATLEIQVNYDKYGGIGESDSQLTLSLPDPGAGTGGIIDCTKTQTAGSFEEAYCRDYNNAKADPNTKTYKFDGNANNFTAKKYETPVFKCDPFKQLETNEIPPTVSETKTNPSLDAKYYENKSYMIGTIDFDLNVGSYVRHYTAHVADPTNCLKYLNDNKADILSVPPKLYYDDDTQEIIHNGKKVEACKWTYEGLPTGPDSKTSSDAFIKETGGNQEPITCKITCNEVVTVEYGYPVASRAGLCFDYKVKVTSRVNCSAEAPNSPRLGIKTCNPEPGCNHGSGFVDHAAGPSEEFDSCVAKCDGGKYTTKCSSQCYQEVYNAGTNALTKTEYYDFADFVATKLYTNNTVARAENAASCQGYYYRVGTADKPVVKWKPVNVFGRWYCDNNAVTKHGCLKTTEEGGGISAVCNCGAVCRWNGCSKSAYLNPGVSEVDDVINRGEYQRAIDACNHYSRCSESQATFNFKVDYTDENNNKQTINFPYSASNPNLTDTIQYNREGHSVLCTSETNKLNTTILQSNGCYKCAETGSTNDQSGSSNNWYMTEWTFPGTWINNKTGEISYEPKTGAGWDKYTGKFCLPKKAGNVNQRWFNAYFIAKNGEDDIYSYFNTSTTTSYDDKTCRVSNCKTYEKGNSGSFPTDAAKDLEYNITAQARSFGLFGWNIDIKCFYATNTKFPEYKGGTTCDHTGECTPTDSVRIRSVDLGNIFPDEKGEKLTDPTKVGRTTVPFNWSQYASNTKTTNYASQPSDYTAWVQTTNYKIYEGEEYLDYEIDLTKELINQIRSDNRNYTNFDGEVVAGSVYNYRSNLFRGQNPILRSSSKFPDESVLGCNNIRNYRSTSCEQIHGESE